MDTIRTRPPGTGTIEELPSGRFRAKLPGKGRKTIGTFDTYEAAERALDAVLLATDGADAPKGVLTLRRLEPAFFAARKAEGGRDVAGEASRWRQHVTTAAFADWPIANVRDHDVTAFRDKLREKRSAWKHAGQRERGKLSPRTVRNVLNLVRGAFAYALEKKFITSNPALGITVAKKIIRTTEPWTYLEIAEQQRLAQVSLGEDEVELLATKLQALFVLGAGLRRGEGWNLELVDLHVADDEHEPRAVIRFGSEGLPPKNGKIRTVPLFGVALAAVRAWLELLPTYAAKKVRGTEDRVPHNPLGLVFPTQRGARRVKAPKLWPVLRRRAGIARRVRWHDLRHTCASSLVAGWWGRTWALIEVCALLGHSSVAVTELYAHLAPDVVRTAARGTGGGPLRSITGGKNANLLAFRRTTEPRVGSSNLPGRAAETETSWTERGPAERLIRQVAEGEEPDAGLVLEVGRLLAAKGLAFVALAQRAMGGSVHALRAGIEAAGILNALEDAGVADAAADATGSGS